MQVRFSDILEGKALNANDIDIAFGVRDAEAGIFSSFFAAQFRPNHPLLNHQYFRWCYGGMRPGTPSWNRDAPYSVITAWNKNQIVGYIGAISIALQVKGQISSAAWYTNIFVTPEFRGCGIGALLIGEGLKHYQFALGAGTTESGLALYRRNGYCVVGCLSRYMRLLAPDTFIDTGSELGVVERSVLLDAASQPTHPAHGNVSIQRSATPTFEIPASYEALWHRISRQFSFVVARTSDYLDWRFRSHPRLTYRNFLAYHSDHSLAGMIIFRVDLIGRSNLVPIVRVLDLLSDDAAVESLLSHLDLYARSIGAAFIEFFCSSPRFATALIRQGYVSSPHPLCTDLIRLYHPPRHATPREIYFSFRLRDDSKHLMDDSVAELSNWYVTLSDSDLDREQR